MSLSKAKSLKRAAIVGYLCVCVWCAGSVRAQTAEDREEKNAPVSSTAQTPPKVTPPADPLKFALIIGGAGGEETYTKQFFEWSKRLQQSLTGRLSFPPEQVRVLCEKLCAPENRSTAEEVRKAFDALQKKATPESSVYIFLIGHGTFDGQQAKFNLVGPDLPVAAYREMLGAIKARRILIFNLASASGEFVKPLAGQGRIIITATRSGQEQTATRFTEYFITALEAGEADADHNQRLSILEVYNYATRLTDEFYKGAGRLATEHALLEDSGDGVGHQTAEAGDGGLARVTYFDSPQSAQGGEASAKLLAERTRLEEAVEQLKTRKEQMPAADYESELEKLLLQLAKTNQSIREQNNGKKTAGEGN